MLVQTNVVILFVMLSTSGYGQVSKDDSLKNFQNFSSKYLKTVEDKIDKYSMQINSRTIKTLEKLSCWENKIHEILNRVNPETAQRLFGDNQNTFSFVLQNVKEGKTITENYQAQYHEYRDRLTIDIKYLKSRKEDLNKKFTKPLLMIHEKTSELNTQLNNSEAVQEFIRERKKVMIDACFQVLGKNRYLTKINSECFYYLETMKNYKATFSNPDKSEQIVKDILNKIPAFQRFMQENSMLASLFGQSGELASAANITHLQTRAGVTQLIQTRMSTATQSVMNQVQQNIQAAQGQLNKMKDKLLNALPGAGNGGGTLPDFKPNMQKTKTFAQRLVYESSFQFAKTSSLMPSTADIGLSVGYKLNDKSIVGIGAAYKMGVGSLEKIRVSTQGVGLRSFIDWKFKKQFFLSGGFEMNYIAELPSQIQALKNRTNWQQSALIGVSKKISARTRLFKETRLQLLYDFLAQKHFPVSQSILFRIGYSF
jgi:hypothetical protein